MELVTTCIICWNEMQCLKPCDCTGRICMACLLRICSEDLEECMKCPQCRKPIKKEVLGLPSFDPDFSRLITTALTQSSIFRIERPRPFVHDIGISAEFFLNPFAGLTPLPMPELPTEQGEEDSTQGRFDN